MNFVMSKIYTSVKGFVCIVTAGAAIAIFTNLDAGIGRYVLGNIVATSAVFCAFDTFGMSAALNKLNKENTRLEKSNDEYCKLNLQLQSNIESLTKLQSSLEKENEEFSQTNDKLLITVDQMKDINKNLISNYTKLYEENAALMQNVDNFKQENIKLTETTDRQEQQIKDLSLIQSQAKQLISTLMSSSSDLNGLHDKLFTSIDRIDSTSAAMTILLEHLSADKFDQIDVNRDGKITQDELLSWSQNRS